MKILYIFILSLIASVSSAQVIDTSDPQLMDNWINELNNTRPDTPMETVIGSPFLNDKFEKATIKTRTQGEFQGIPIRYNLHQDHIEYINNGEVMVLFFGAQVMEAHLNGVIYKYLEASGQKGGYQVIYEGEQVSVYKKQAIMLLPEKTGYGTVRTIEARYKKAPDSYLIIDASGKVTSIKNKKELNSFTKPYRKDGSVPKSLDDSSMLAFAQRLDQND